MAGFQCQSVSCQKSAALAGHVLDANRADDCKVLMGRSPMPFDRVLHRLALIDTGIV